MSPLELGAKAQDVIRKVQKLLAIAADARGNENQAVSAAAKAQELLQAYNLSMDVVEARQGARKDNKLAGGLYKWQRDLWRATARLNFCMYWAIKGLEKGSTYQHRLLGREENVVGARVMAEYLQQTVERLAQAEAKTRGVNVFCREMIAFREGMSERLTERLDEVRWQKLEEERKAQREAAKAAPQGPTNGTSVVLSSLIQTEEDLNTDFWLKLEPGTTARQRHEREIRQQAALKRYEEELAARERWRLEHPEEAAKQEAARRKAEEKARKQEERNAKRRKGDGFRYRQPTPEEVRQMLPEFRQGRRKAEDVSLRQQVDKADESRKLGS